MADSPRALTAEAFLASVAGAAPPQSSPALRGLWHALRGEWDAAHDAVQPDDPDCAWVHAALHHEEGDLANAGYWYGCAGRSRPARAGREEFEAIVRALLRSRRSP